MAISIDPTPCPSTSTWPSARPWPPFPPDPSALARENCPPGTHRGYNVIEIDDDFLGARVHVREVEAVTNLFSRGPRMAFGGESYTDLRWEAPPDLMGRPRAPAAEAMLNLITEAERCARINPRKPSLSCDRRKPCCRPSADDY